MATPAAQPIFPDDDALTRPAGAIDHAASPDFEHALKVTPPHEYRFSFTGTTSEYFRIWLVSLALSVLTIGIYSAWGKVRKKRYLYHHTRVADSGFEYRASPMAILRGRVIALVLFGGLAFSGHVLIEAQFAFLALIALLTPWIAIASARFNARNTFYRSVGFDFDGTLREAVKVYLGFGAIVLLTLGIAYPWFQVRRARFIVASHRFGATPFTIRIGTGEFFLAYLLALLAVIGAFVLAAGIVFLTMTGKKMPSLSGTYGAILVVYASYIVVYAFLRAFTQNRIANGTSLGPLHLDSGLSGKWLAWIYVTNIVAVLATLGLATPWAVIRITRYRARTLSLSAASPIESLPVARGGKTSATGSEISDLFDVDVAL